MNIEVFYRIKLTKEEAGIWNQLISKVSDSFLKEQIKLNDDQISKLHDMYIEPYDAEEGK